MGRGIFRDSELLIRNWSHTVTYLIALDFLFFLYLLMKRSSQKRKPNRIGMKFGTIIQVNTHRLTEWVFTAQCTLVHLRCLAIACRLSVRPSVTLVICDHIDWKSWKLIAWAISPASSLFAAKRRFTPRGTWRNFGETRCGVGKKWRAGEQKRQYLWNA